MSDLVQQEIQSTAAAMPGSHETVVFTDGVVERAAGSKGAGIFVTRDFPRGSLLIEQHVSTKCSYCQSKLYLNKSDENDTAKTDPGDEHSDTSEALVERNDSDEDDSDEDYSDEDYSDEDYSDEDYSDEDDSEEDDFEEDGSDEDDAIVGEQDVISNEVPNPEIVLEQTLGSCRINHSCAPNVVLRDDKPQHIRVYTLRDISAGEEVLTSYLPDLALPSAVRAQWLGFDCQCTICTSPHLAESDARRVRLGGIYLGLEHTFFETQPDGPHAIMPQDDKEALLLAQEFMQILIEEGLCGPLLSEGHVQLAIFYMKNGRFDESDQAN
ncbi:hypothetical protein F5Y18DRAFT_425111 [Xylariaceae sp. FL1019]|nr:hypothetical protein F5Y18DRAFT_425111 [Xylariaceae sp. FL1019]